MRPGDVERGKMPFSMRQVNVYLTVIVLFVCLAGGGWGLRVTTIQLGRSLNADDTVGGHTTRFAPGDTVYVSIHTAGVGSGKIGVRWMYGDRGLGEPSEQVSYRSGAAT